jgi:hypothetical protein
MAKMKRGLRTGAGGSDLTNTLGSLFRTTLEQASVVREVFERGAKEGKARLDEVRSDRRRSSALTELGEIVLDLVRRGEIDIEELPEIADVVSELDRIDDSDTQSTGGEAAERRERLRRAQTPTVRHGNSERRGESRDVPMARSSEYTDQGRSRPTRSPSLTQPETLLAKLRREADGTLNALRDAGRSVESAAKTRGGISFDRDADVDGDGDLSDYMHPNDVPDHKK